MTRTLSLRERDRVLVRLGEADVAFFRSLPRRWVRVERVGRRHLLTVGNIAGTLAAPTCRLAIAPKLPVASLWLLLDAEPPATTPTPTGPVVADALLDAVAGGFLALLAERVAAGLRHGYREQALAAPILHGRLDLATQLRQAPTRPEMLHQIHDAFTPDVPCNQLLRAALDALLAVPGLAAATRAGAVRLGAPLAAVQPLPTAQWTAPLDAPAEYGRVVDAARLLLAGLASGGGAAPGVVFVVEMERLFERWLLRGLEAAAPPGVVVEPQARRVLRDGSGPALVVKPDALVFVAGSPRRAIDAKWKRLHHGRPVRSDLYQALAYAETLALPETVLVYPGRRTRRRDFPPTLRGTRLSVWTVRLEDRGVVVSELLGA